MSDVQDLFGFDTIEFDDVEPIEEFELLPEGSYDAEIIEAAFGKSSNKKSPQIELAFEIQQEGFEDRRAWDNLSLVPTARGFLMTHLMNMGVRTREQLAKEGLDLNQSLLNDLVGTRTTIHIRHSKSQDGQRTFANVRRYAEYGTGRGARSGAVAAASSSSGDDEEVEIIDGDLDDLFG